MKWWKMSFKVCCIVIMCSCAGKKSVVSNNTRTFDLSSHQDEVTIMWANWNIPQNISYKGGSKSDIPISLFCNDTIHRNSPEMGIVKIVKKSSHQEEQTKAEEKRTETKSRNYNGYYILLALIICICAIKLLSLWSN